MSAKYQQLADNLRQEFEQVARQGGGKLPTEAALSQRYQMSRQTVRHALQTLRAEGLIERRQGSGSYIAGKTTPADPRQIAVVTTFLDDYIFPTILHDAQLGFSQEGYSTFVFATENHVASERGILQKLLQQNVSAILIEGSKTALPTPNSDLFEQLQQNGVPVLFLHGVYGNLSGFPCLLDDNYSGGYQLARYLIEKGHTRLAGIFKSDDIQGPQRYHGVVSALRDAALELPDARFGWYDTEERKALVSGQDNALLDRFIATRLSDATAVVCYNDEIAHFLIQRLLELGRRVPEEIAVVSFDNSFYSQVGPVPITSLGHKQNRTGKAAAQILLEIRSGAQPRSVCLEWELTQRASG